MATRSWRRGNRDCSEHMPPRLGILVDRQQGWKTQHAFTLLELLLTLSVIAVIASLTLPSISLLLGDRGLVRGANQIQAEMTRLRVDAMRSGQVLVMQAQTGTQQLRVIPYFADSVDASADVSRSDAGFPSGRTIRQERMLTLDDRLQIQSVSAVSALRGVAIEQALSGSGRESWSQPIVFYPDGTTSTAAVVLVDPDYGKVIIRLRGLTGEVSVTEVLP